MVFFHETPGHAGRQLAEYLPQVLVRDLGVACANDV
jgi:hypothetical protein